MRKSKQKPGSISILEQAIGYAARGWRVLPLHWVEDESCSCGKDSCSSVGKHPLTSHGVHDATDDEAQIRQWFGKWPGANLGIATGPESHLIVVDVDGPQGLRSLRELMGTTALELPDTPTVFTGRVNQHSKRCGLHLYFAYPRYARLGSSICSIARGIDVKGAGGYVVAPPSVHASGLRYRWRTNTSDIPGEAPEWLITKTSGRQQSQVSPEAAFYDGERNTSLFRIGSKKRRSGASEGEILRYLQQNNERKCLPPLKNSELMRIAGNAARTPLGPNPLEKAWAEISSNLDESDYRNLLRLAEQLQRRARDGWILLPVVAVGRLMKIDPATVCRLRKQAVHEGRLELVEDYVPRVSAAKYRYKITAKQYAK